MPIGTSLGEQYKNEDNFLLGVPEGRTEAKTQGGTPVPTSENNSPASSVEAPRGIVQPTLAQTYIPTALRAYVSMLEGDKTPITENFFHPSDIEILRNAAEKRLAKGDNYIGYGDYGEQDPWSEGTKGVLDALKDPGKSLAFTLGMAKIHKEDDGTLVIQDKYNWDAKNVDQKRNAWDGMKMLAQGAASNGLLGIGNVIGNYMSNGDGGRDVNIRIPPKQENNLPDINDVPHHDWIEGMFKAIPKAFALPGDILSGKVQAGSVQEIERAADLAGLMVAGPAPVASKMADGTLGSFAGVASKTIDRNALAEAQIMKSNGAHPDEVWSKTGFFQGADGRWRYEIPDKSATLNMDKDKLHIDSIEDPKTGGELHTVISIPANITDFFGATKNSLKLPDILDHPELYKAYPDLKNISVQRLPQYLQNKGIIGQMDNNRNILQLADYLDPAFAKSVMLHEIQHAIQRREGFARGASSSEFQNPGLEEAQRIYDNAIKKGGDPNSPSLKEGLRLIEEEKARAHEMYWRTMGEVEARNVQARMYYDKWDSKSMSPERTEDRPRFLQITPKN